MQNEKKKEDPKKKQPAQKPANPDVKGAPAPDDNDPRAQYENKDES